MGVAEMHDAAFGIERRRNHTLAAEHMRSAEARLQRIEMTDAVQQRQNRRVRSDCRREGGHRAVEVVGLAREQHQVECLGELVCEDQRRRRQVGVTQPAADRKAGPRQLRRAPRAHEKGHFATDFEQPAAEIPADRPGPYHESTHVTFLARSPIPRRQPVTIRFRARARCLGRHRCTRSRGLASGRRDASNG